MFDTYAEIFNQRAHAYHSAMKRSPRVRDAEFRAVLEPIDDAPDGLVCDMPSGGCYLAAYLRPGLSYVGVEPVQDFLDTRSAIAVETVNATIVDVPLPDSSIDYVISLAGLHHEESLAAVFGEMRRLVRPGGRVVMADVAVDTPPAVFLNGFVARNNPLGHDGRFLDSGTAGIVEAAGLRVIEDQLLECPWSFATVEESGPYCAELFGITGCAREAVTDVLVEEIGFDTDGGGARLKWLLRRIVCEPA